MNFITLSNEFVLKMTALGDTEMDGELNESMCEHWKTILRHLSVGVCIVLIH